MLGWEQEKGEPFDSPWSNWVDLKKHNLDGDRSDQTQTLALEILEGIRSFNG